jgi:hypothetical protein
MMVVDVARHECDYGHDGDDDDDGGGGTAEARLGAFLSISTGIGINGIHPAMHPCIHPPAARAKFAISAAAGGGFWQN